MLYSNYYFYINLFVAKNAFVKNKCSCYVDGYWPVPDHEIDHRIFKLKVLCSSLYCNQHSCNRSLPLLRVATAE